MKRIVLLALFIISLCCQVVFLNAETLEMLSNKSFPAPVMPEVTFLHDDHNDRAKLEDCSVCHHHYENGARTDESSEGTPCADCHRPALHSRGFNLSAAYHGLCKTCHLDQKKGPVACGECHKSN